MDEQGPNRPFVLGKMWGRVRSLGPDALETAGQKFAATKYEIHLGYYPSIFVWLTEDGVVLATQSEEATEPETKLVKSKKYEDLPKLKPPPPVAR